MKRILHALAFLLLAITASAQIPNTGQYTFNRKTSTSFAADTITPIGTNLLRWNGSGRIGQVSPLTFLTPAQAAALYQPLNATLTALSLITTTGYGRGFLSLADAAAARTYIGAGTGTGSVTTVSVTTANGISGSVANPTTTPAITLTLGAITPSSVAATGNVTGLNLSGTNTGDQTLNGLLPSQGGNSGKFLKTNGTNASWQSLLSADITDASEGGFGAADAAKVVLFGNQGQLLGSSSGSLSAVSGSALSNGDAIHGVSVDGTGGYFQSTNGQAFQATNTNATEDIGHFEHAGAGLHIKNDGGLEWTSLTGRATTVTALALSVGDITNMSANARTFNQGADYSAMRTLLGVRIGVQVQAWGNALDVLSTTTPSTDAVPYYTSSNTASTFPVSTTGRLLAAAGSATLGRAILSAAPLSATYITQTANSELSAEQALGALGTGILKNTTTTGVLSIAVAGDFPTLNQSTTGSAATLTTPRSIYGNNFDGSAALAQVIASTFGGTGNGFTKFTGPTTSEKTFTLPNASATVLTDNAAVTVAQGGSGATTAAGARTNFGATTVGSNLFTLTNPSAITYARINADNTVTARTMPQSRSDLALHPVTITPIVGGSIASTSTLLADVTGSTITLPDTGWYEFHWFIYHSAAATSTGAWYSVNTTGTLTADLIDFRVDYDVLSTDKSTYAVNGFNAAIPSTSSRSTGAVNKNILEGVIHVTTAGAIILRFATEVGASAITITDLTGYYRNL